MAETKPTDTKTTDLRAENERLRAENENLRGQLAASGARAYQPAQRFVLSEGDRQELEIRGVVNIGGRLLTKDEVMAELGPDQRRVEIADAPDTTRVDDRTLAQVRQRRDSAVLGVDYVYPSVEPGKIDPAVAGTPGINGPAADKA